MTKDPFADTEYGKLALRKMQPVSDNFRLYSMGWLETGGPPETWEVMEVTGAEFRAAKTGPNKGKLTILVPNTRKTAHVHISEVRSMRNDQ